MSTCLRSRLKQQNLPLDPIKTFFPPKAIQPNQFSEVIHRAEICQGSSFTFSH